MKIRLLFAVIVLFATGGCRTVMVQISSPIGGEPQLMVVRNATGLSGTIEVVAGTRVAVTGLPNGAMGVDPRSWQAYDQNMPILILHRNENGLVDAVAVGNFGLSAWGTTQNIWDVAQTNLIHVGPNTLQAAHSASTDRVRMRAPRVIGSGLAILQVGLFWEGRRMVCTASTKKNLIVLSSGEWWADTFPAVGGRNGGVDHTLSCVIHHPGGESEAMPTFRFRATDYRVDGHQYVVTPRGATERSP